MAETVDVQKTWFTLSPEEVARELQVDLAKGLSAAEAQQRLQKYGPNQLAGKPKEPGWQAFLRQYKDFMQILLLGAAIVSVVVTGEWGTTLVLVVLTIFNAVLGLNQESKAEASLAALEKMMKNIARVRRGPRDFWTMYPPTFLTRLRWWKKADERTGEWRETHIFDRDRCQSDRLTFLLLCITSASDCFS